MPVLIRLSIIMLPSGSSIPKLRMRPMKLRMMMNSKGISDE